MKCTAILFLFVCYLQFSLILCGHENPKVEKVVAHRRSEARKSGHPLHRNDQTSSTHRFNSKHGAQSRRSHRQQHNRRSKGAHAEQDWLENLPDHHIKPRSVVSVNQTAKIILGNAEARSNCDQTNVSNDDISIIRPIVKITSNSNDNFSTSRRSNNETGPSSNDQSHSNSSDYSKIHSNDETAETQATQGSKDEKHPANNATSRVRRSNDNIQDIDDIEENYELLKQRGEAELVLTKDQDQDLVDKAIINDENTVVISLNDIDEAENEVLEPSSWSAHLWSLFGFVLPQAPRSKRMINAFYATHEYYPYVVTIMKNGQHWCSGSLVSRRAVITSANCFLVADPDMRVRVGTRHAAFGGHLVGIQEVMFHPNWTHMDEPSPDFDVAVVVLNRTIKHISLCHSHTPRGRYHGAGSTTSKIMTRFSDDLHAVELPPESMMPPFDDAWVTSFGTKNPDGGYDILDGDLEVYRTTLVNMTYCKNVTKLYRTKVTGNHICLSQKDHKAPCTRDTGAPAVSDGYLWGVASWGIRKRCGGILVPAMFSYLGAPDNAEFIKNAMLDIQRKYPYKKPI